jgi:hypothetical protein
MIFTGVRRVGRLATGVRGWRSMVFGVAAGLSALWALALAGSAAALPTNCSQSGSTVTCTFSYTGSEQTFTVPAGVSAVAITAVGAPGGAGFPNGATASSGGDGATVSATVPVSAGPLSVEVGGGGGNGGANTEGPGGFNGGGGGGTDMGGGGGASDVRTCSIANCSLSSSDTRLVVAGGGGGGIVGGGPPGAGGSAGSPLVSGPGAGAAAPPGGAGGDGGFGGMSGGAGGSSDQCSGNPGALGQGGTGSTNCSPDLSGGGGGAGYYGGGAGGFSADSTGTIGGGGAGSSFWIIGATGTSMSEDSTGTPSVTISYTAPPSASDLAATLVSDSRGKGPGTALADKATAIRAAVNAGQTVTACADITDYLGLVKAQNNKSLTRAKASQLTTDATNLAAALGC